MGRKIPYKLPTKAKRLAITPNQPLYDKEHKALGIITGKQSDITVIDCDDEISYEILTSIYSEFKKYYTVKTKKGYHIYCKYTDQVSTSIKYIEGIDIMNDDSIIFAPPTSYTLPDGTIAEYKYLSGKVLGEFPEFLIKKLKDAKKAKEPVTKKTVKPTTTPTPTTLITIRPQDENLLEYFQLIVDAKTKEEDKYYNNRMKWIKIGMLIYSLDMPLSVWIMFSKNSNKFQEGECEKIWSGFDRKSYTVGSLFWIAKQCNEKEYYKLRQKHTFESVYEKPIVEIVEMNRRYLLDKVNDDSYVICEEMIKHLNTLMTTDVKVLNIKSPYGTSKTQLMIKMIELYNPKRILMLSYRQTLTLDLKKNFEALGFEDYLTGNIEADRVIVQVESLLKLDTESIVRQYDLVIMDESERVLNQFNSNTTFHGAEKDTFDYLYHIIDGSKKLICMDGGQTNRTYSFTQNFGKTLSLNNTAKVHEYEIPLYYQKSLWENEMIRDLKNNKKIVIPSISASNLDILYKKLVGLFPEKKIKLYTGDTDSKVKMEDAKDVVKAWGELDCLLYSPTIEAGVNFDVEHFDCLYPEIITGGCSQESFFQMISRVRHLKSKIIKTYKGDIPDYEFSDFWNFEEVKAGMIESRDCILKPMYVKTENGQIERLLKLEPYNVNAIYNKIEDLNKNKYYFMSYLKHLGAKKGYKIYNHCDLFEEEEEDTEEKDTKSKMKNVLEAPDINQVQLNELLFKQKHNIDTTEEKKMIQKEMYKRELGVDILNEEILKPYFKKTSCIKNFFHLLHDDSVFEGNTQHVDDCNGRLDIVRKLIKLMGWESVNDKKVLNQNQFEDGIIQLVCQSKAFTDPKMTKMLFGMSKCKIETTDKKKALRYINELLKHFSIKIDVSYSGRREAKNQKYSLVELNSISEIIYNLIYKKKRGYILGEKNYFVEPIEFKFKHLVIDCPKIPYGSNLDYGLEDDMFNDV